jgi:hypothetical protein
MHSRTKLIGTLAVTLAIAAPSASNAAPDDDAEARGPGAIAASQAILQHPDNRAGARGVGSITASTGSPRAVRPDDRPGLRGPGAATTAATSAVSHPDNRAGARGPGVFTTVVTAPSTDGFDWRDAMIGSVGGLGAALLLTGAFVLVSGQRGRTRAA